MKSFSPVLLACVLAIPALAQEVKTNSSPTVEATLAVTNQVASVTHEVGQTFSVSAGVVTAPFVLTNGYISQAVQNEIATDGKAIYNFAITNAGSYVIKAMANAPSEDANSFYLNVDAQPTDPDMIWDIEVTTGFQERVVSWRGSGSTDSDEFSPKIFKLSEGAHKLIVVGREAETQLKALTIVPADK